ncbi:hypothetical protein ANCDUO_19274 [Ancylostoma duodenale]|uniref:Uncharacterized protein n=1 Tax=Ancylostoma duodenale TaxID=51022 RepID=A0A0C2G0P8_9BILA|nr:hypothetical protein ANCDUO_19274 [Ancylostoma duodenale]
MSSTAQIFGSISIKLREKFSKIKDKAKKMLELTPKMMASLKEKLKKLRPRKYVKVHEEGDSIEEINQNNGVGAYLFQSDIVLNEYVCSPLSSIGRVSKSVSSEQLDEVVKPSTLRLRENREIDVKHSETEDIQARSGKTP